MLTILGTLLGGLFRLAPAILQFMDKKDERAHEALMFDKQLEADKVKAQAAQALEETKGENAINLADINALIEATKAQGQLTGLKWVDAINSTVRPFLTYWWAVGLYTAFLAAEFYVAVWVIGRPTYDAILGVFGEPEKAIVASMISFWFVDRAIKHKGR